MTTDTQDPQQTEQTATEESQAVNREELEQATKTRLAEAFADEEADTEESEDTSEDTDTAKDGGGEEEEESPDGGDTDEDDDTQPEGDDTDDTEDTEAAAQPTDAPTLPDQYRRSLYAYGWDDDEINANLRNLGDSFVKTAERIHENRNTELEKWAQAGRQARDSRKSEQEQDGSQDTQGKGDQPSKLAPVDAAKLKEQYGEDELIDAIVGPVNAAIESLNSVVPQIQKGQQAVQNAEVEQVSRQIDQFFNRDDLKPYQEVYGSDPQKLNDEQTEKRNKVLDTAYDLMVGAESLRNESIPLQDALEYAHEIVAKDAKVTRARNTVKKEAKRRNKGISQKPSAKSGGTQNESGEPQSRTELEKRTARRLQEAFS